MNDIQLKKGGKIAVKMWDRQSVLEKEIENYDLNFHIHDTVEFEKGFSLRDVFLLYSRNVELFSMIVGCPFIEDLIEEALQPISRSNLINDGLSALVVRWVAHDNENEIVIYPTLFGTGLDKEFVLVSAPLNEIAFLPLILDTQFKIYRKKDCIFSSRKPFTLLEMTRAIFDELGNWPPDMRDLMEVSVDEKEIEIPIKVKKPCKKCSGDASAHVFGKPKNICINCFKAIKEN